MKYFLGLIAASALSADAFQPANRALFLRSPTARASVGGDHGHGVGRRQWVSSTAAVASAVAALQGRLALAADESDTAVPGSAPDTAPPPAAAAAAAEEVYAEGFPYDSTVPYKGKDLSLKRLRAKATIVCNTKTDDPEATRQLPALAYLSSKYSGAGLRVIAVPTDQGWYEPEVSEIVRIRALQTHGFGAFPVAFMTDKVDILGATAHPLFTYMMRAKPNPNGRMAVSLNFEKFLLDGTGKVMRRYPRKLDGYQMERDVAAVLEGRDLPAETPEFLVAWKEAARESIKSEYAFRMGYNLYKQESASQDWNGIVSDGFR